MIKGCIIQYNSGTCNTAYHILATRRHGRALITGSIMHAEGWDGCHHFEGCQAIWDCCPHPLPRH